MEPRPRVLIVVTLAEIGGAQTYVGSLVAGLAQEFDVTVAAYGPGPLRGAVEAAGGRYVALTQVRRPVRPLRDLLGLLELVRICRRERPQILHLNSSKAGILGRLAGWITRVPIRIFTVHGWAFNATSGPAAVAYRWLDRLGGRITTATICVSEHDHQEGIAAGACSPTASTIIHNAIDVAAAPRAALEDGRPPRVIAVGRLKGPKDFVTLVRALAALEPGTFRACIVGEGPDRPRLEAEIRRLGLDGAVELLGECEDVAGPLAASQLFVLPSLSEGLPMSIIEAMAAGLPVVASRVGGIPELVDDGITGALVPAGDPDALAAVLARLLGDRDARTRMGAAARARAEERFDIERFHAAHRDLYRDLLRRREAPAPRSDGGSGRAAAAASRARRPPSP